MGSPLLLNPNRKHRRSRIFNQACLSNLRSIDKRMNDMKRPYSQNPSFLGMIRLTPHALLLGILSMIVGASPRQALAGPQITTTTLTVTQNGVTAGRVAWGSAVTLTATVKTGSSAVKSGQVDFCDAAAAYCEDIHLLATAQLTGAGTASVHLRPAIGIHRYKAVFVGTTSNATSTSNVPAINVTGKYDTATSIFERGFVGNYSLTATVAGFANSTGIALPTGTVSFLDTNHGNEVLGSATLGTAPAGLNWMNSQNPATGMNPGDVAVGDFNGDGIPDLAVTNGTNSITILLGNGDGTFRVAPVSPPPGNSPSGIVAGDFNNDGKLDLAVVNSGDNTITILLGNGDGTFKPAAAHPATGGSPNSIAVADFNRDGNLDLVLVNACAISAYCTTNAQLTILLGDGQGGFTPSTSNPSVNGYSDGVVVGDFNGDGIPDLAVPSPNFAQPDNASVAIFLGNGDGTFTADGAVWAGYDPETVVVADFNGDGIPDMAVTAGGGSGGVTILLGNGDGTFAAAANSPALNYPGALAVGDFNGDGKADLAVVNELGGYLQEITVLLGDGKGGFSAASVSPPTTFVPGLLVLADLNEDGVPDIVATNYESNNLMVLLTQVQTVVAAASGISPVGPGEHQVKVSYGGDANYNASASPKINLMELPPASTTTLAATSAGEPVTAVVPGTLVALTATVQSSGAKVTRGQVNFCDATAEDCTGIYLLGTAQITSEGTAVLRLVPGIGSHTYKADFLGSAENVPSSSKSLTLTVAGKYATAASIAQQGIPGNYTLTATVSGSVYEVGLSWPTGIVSFVDTSNGNAVLGSAALGKGTSSLNWLSASSPATGIALFYSVAFGDFNGDGIPDIAIANDNDSSSDSTVTILLGNGDGSFKETATSPTTSGSPTSIAVADFNGDGNMDLAVANGASITILLGHGDGTFTRLPESVGLVWSGYSFAVGDFNGDGIPDLAVANLCGSDLPGTGNCGGSVSIFLGKGDGTFTRVAASPATGDQPSQILVGDFNGDGKADLAVSSSAVNSDSVTESTTILLGNGDGTFTPAPTLLGVFAAGLSDFNGDGKTDLIVENTGSLTIMLGKGNGTFATGTTLPAGSSPSVIGLGDFNGDGRVDVAVSNAVGYPTYAATVTLLLGNGDGTFKATAGPAPSLSSYYVRDLNGDGRTDLITLGSGSSGNPDALLGMLTQVTETATATVSGISPAGAGPHEVEASYPGNSSFGASVSGATILFKQPPATTTTLAFTSAGKPVTSVSAGAAVTLQASVTDYGAAVATGQVNFCDAGAAHCTDIHLLGTAQLSAAGIASLKLRPSPGSRSYKAQFLGTTSDLPSASAASSLTVTGRFATRTSLAQSGAAGDYTLTATVTSSAGNSGAQPITGNVYFLDTSDGDATLGRALLVDGGIGWLSSQTLAAANNPDFIATGDLNGDGIPDIVVAGVNSETVTILLGNGDGTFTPAPNSVTEGNYAYSVAVGDLNGDGIPDLAIATQGDYSDEPGSVTIWLGKGDGTFTQGASPAAGVAPQSVVIADFNGDGIPDLAVANSGDNNLTILLGNGDGTFKAAKVSPATGNSPYSIGVGDFNGDGKPDLAVANTGSNSVTVLLGNGDGTFKAAASPATGSAPSFLVVADLNGDGTPDLAVANGYGSSLTILLGDGKGGFKPAPASPATGSTPYSIAVGDFNGDGKPDLAVACLYATTLTVLLGNGDGTFTTGPGPAAGANPDAIAAADFNGDGISDLVAGNSTSGSVTVLLAEEQTATATAAGISPVGAGQHLVEARYAGDSFHNSGISPTTVEYEGAQATTTTLAVTSGAAPVTVVEAGEVVTLTATVKSGNSPVTPGQVNFCDASVSYCTDIHLLGTGQLSSAGTAVLKLIPGIGTHSYKAVFAGVAHYDTASSSSPSALTVTGKFSTTTAITESGTIGNYTLTATVTGIADKSTSPSPTGTVSFLDTSAGNSVLGTAVLSSGAGALGWLGSQVVPASQDSELLAVGDFNGDGIPDLAVADANNDTVTILQGSADGTFKVVSSATTGGTPMAIVAADFNGDGKTDLAVANSGGTVTVLLGHGDGTFTGSVVNLASGSFLVAAAVGDFNGDGIPDLAVANDGGNSSTITILLGNGDGTFTQAANPVTAAGPECMVVGDFNGDGKADLAIANGNLEYPGTLTILLGNGDGTFKPGASPAAGGVSGSIAVADFNHDGKIDLAVINADNFQVAILLGNGDGTFQTPAFLATGTLPYALAVGDFNGDGITDLAIANGYSAASILLGKGDGTFTSETGPTNGSVSLAAADFNGDGLTDLVFVTQNDGAGGPVSVELAQLTKTGTATLSSVALQSAAAHLVEASYPGDGNFNPSVSSAIAVPPMTATPVFKPAAGSYSSAQTVTISDPSSTATIYYTTNGKTPTISSTKYAGAIAVNSTETLNAIAVASGYSQSAVATATYSIQPPLSALKSIAVSPGSPVTPLGSTLQFSATGTYTDSSMWDITALVAWTSSKTAVATVSRSGLATPVASGSTTVTAKVGSVTSAAATLTVIPQVANAYSAPAEPVGTGSAAQTATILISNSFTLGSIAVVTQGAPDLDFNLASGGTCTIGTAYIAGETCTVNYTFKPKAPGARMGAIEVFDNASPAPNRQAIVFLGGTGAGPLVAFYPGTQSAVGYGIGTPENIAVDASGDIYLADWQNNAVYMETPSNGGYVQSTIGNGLWLPTGVGVDGAGNVFICDTQNSRVLKETLFQGQYAQTVIENDANNSLRAPVGVAVDASGNVYIADSFDDVVYKETPSARSYVQTIVADGFLDNLGSPAAVAVDGSGNVYIADSALSQVWKETLSAGSYTMSLIGSGLNAPSGVWVDGSGNVYISDTANNRVLKETLSNGSYMQSEIVTGLKGPIGVAVDGKANLYIADSGNSRLLMEGFASPPNLTFAGTAVGSTSHDSPQTVTLVNNGNAPLTFPVPSTGSNPSISANFTLNQSAASACPLLTASSTLAGTLASGATCLLSIGFQPATAGAIAGSLVVTDNSLNQTNASQTILLSGAATNAAQSARISRVIELQTTLQQLKTP
jgi:sugar lactone lactonase YvrE